jgi:hypothetical protein
VISVIIPASPILDTVPYCYPGYPLIRYRIKNQKAGANNGDGRDLQITGVHMDRQARESTPFAPAIREVAMKHLSPSEPALA